MNKLLTFLAAGLLATGGVSQLAAASSPWGVRLRVTYLQTVDKSDAFTVGASTFAADSVVISDRTIPEFDITYDFTPNWTGELVLTIPQKHTVTLQGLGRLGTFKHLPPTLLVQYRPTVSGNFRPYFSAGVNYTLIFDTELSAGGSRVDLNTNSLGLAGQIGFDYRLSDSWTFNFDLKKAGIQTDVKAGGAVLTEARLNPWMYSIGLRRQF